MSIAHLEILLANRRACEDKAGVRYEVLERAVAEFRALAERICNCGAHQALAELNVADKDGEAMFHFTRLRRVGAEDKINGWDEVFAAAGQRVSL